MADRKRKSGKFAVWLLVALLAGIALITRQFILHYRSDFDESRRPPYEVQFPIFGTYAGITIWEDEKTAAAAAEDIMVYLRQLHDLINNYNEKSELSDMNREAYKSDFQCSDQLWEMIMACDYAYEISEGSFDASIGPLMQLWGFHTKRDSLPTEEEIHTALDAVGWAKLYLNRDTKTIRFSHPDTYLDMGGIAKGFALEKAASISSEHGVRRGLINLGGNLYCFNTPPPGAYWYKIGIQDPFERKELMGTVDVKGTCVASSGNYERFQIIEGKRFTHIINPKTGYPVENVAGVTIITPRGLHSDIFSTAVFISGPDMARKLNRLFPKTRILLVTEPEENLPKVQSFSWLWSDYKWDGIPVENNPTGVQE